MSSEVTPPPRRAEPSGRPAEAAEPTQTPSSTTSRGGTVGGEGITDSTTLRNKTTAADTGTTYQAADSDDAAAYGSTASHERPMRDYDNGPVPHTRPAPTAD